MDGGVGAGQKYASIGWTVFAAAKGADLTDPGPANSWLFLDEHPNAIDDEILYINPGDTNGVGFFSELPGSLHNGAGAVTFCDGHTEIHKWLDPRTTPPVNPTANVSIMGTYQQVFMTAPNQDLAWFASKTPRAQ